MKESDNGERVTVATAARGECLVHSGWHEQGRICLGWRVSLVPSSFREWWRLRRVPADDSFVPLDGDPE